MLSGFIWVNMPRIICLMGATAVGKTDLAVALARHLPCDLISVDSAMVYRGMNIGTAKPDAAVLAAFPHRLLDIRDVSERYSAADFREDALREIAATLARGRIPLLVGGTMLYFHALQHGLAPLPAADPQVRHQLLQQAAEQGWDALHQRLHQVDPDAAARIHAHDTQRIQRALEVYTVSGVPMSAHWQHAQTTPFPYRVLNLVLTLADRDVLHQRIQQRLQQMFAQGFIAEVNTFFRCDALHPPPAALRAVGYRQVWRYLAGELTESALFDAVLFATRQFAKRQLTWLRAWQDVQLIDALAEQRVHTALQQVEYFLRSA